MRSLLFTLNDVSPEDHLSTYHTGKYDKQRVFTPLLVQGAFPLQTSGPLINCFSAPGLAQSLRRCSGSVLKLLPGSGRMITIMELLAGR